MNNLKFKINNLKDLGYKDEPGKAVHIYIDDKNLLHLIHFFEKRFNREKESYEGTDPWWLYHRLKEKNMVYVFGCAGCLEPGCWPIEIDIEETPLSVVWKNFRNPYHSHKNNASGREFWDYSEFLSFEFSKDEYNLEIEKLRSEIEKEVK